MVAASGSEVRISLRSRAGTLGILVRTQARGHDVATARTMLVNMFCVTEVVYLFSVRHPHHSSFSLRGLPGKPAVSWAMAAVVIAQLAFTCTSWMRALFDTRPVPAVEGLMIAGIGAAMMRVLAFGKSPLRRLRIFDELGTMADRAGPLPGAKP